MEESDQKGRELFFSNIRRPQWDVQVLLDIGFDKILVNTDVKEDVYDEITEVRYQSIPPFMIRVEKTKCMKDHNRKFGCSIILVFYSLLYPFQTLEEKQRIFLQGEPANPINPPPGCRRFHPRCPHAVEKCRQEEPLLKEMSENHFASCQL